MRNFILALFLLTSCIVIAQDTTFTTFTKVQKGIVYQYRIDTIQKRVITEAGKTETKDSIIRTLFFEQLGNPPVDGGNDDTLRGMVMMPDFANDEFEPYTSGFEIYSEVWPYYILMNTLNGIQVSSNIGAGGLVDITNNKIQITRDGYNPTDASDILRRAEIETIVSSGTADFVKKSAVDTITANKLFTNNAELNLDTGSKILIGNPASDYLELYDVNDATFLNIFNDDYPASTIQIQENLLMNFGTGSGGADHVHISSDGIQFYNRVGNWDPDTNSVLRQKEISDLVSDSLANYISNVTATGYLTGGGSSGSISIGVDTTGNVGLATKNDIAAMGDITGVTVTGYLTGGSTSGNATIGIDTTGSVGIATKYDLTSVSGGSASGSTGQVQYNSSGSFAGANNIYVESGNLKIDSTATPSAPTRGTILYTSEAAGIEEPYFINSDGFGPSKVQASLRDKNVMWLEGSGAGGVINVFGTAFPTTSYSTTLTAATTSGTNSYTKQIKTELLKTSAAGTNLSFWMINAANWRRGDTNNKDGFMYTCTFGVATGTSNTSHRMFSGLSSSITAPTDADPSSIANIIAFAYDDTDANVQFMHNDGSGTATKIDLGSNFPKPAVDRQESYEIEINSRPNGAGIHYRIRRIHTGDVASGYVTTDIPSNTTYLAPRCWVSCAGVSAVTGIALMKAYLETGEY